MNADNGRTYDMNIMKRRLVGVCVGLAGVALPLVAAGAAHADEGESTTGYPSTQSPSQGASALESTLGEASFGFNDALNGDNRPDGANGVETEFPPADPRYVEGPLGGLATNGPFE